jgi:hypothetical protein
MPAAPRPVPSGKASFTRWVRARSEEQLLVAAQRRVALAHGLELPPPPRGVDILWQRVYAPLFHRVPYGVRALVASRLPGSHRKTWHTPPQASGPAV